LLALALDPKIRRRKWFARGRAPGELLVIYGEGYSSEAASVDRLPMKLAFVLHYVVVGKLSALLVAPVITVPRWIIAMA
jgi:hypothetical protein